MTVPRPAADDRNAAVLAGFLGWTLDAFDFFLVVMTLPGFARGLGRWARATALPPPLRLRALFGIRMRGEWGVGASLVMEKVPPRYRGVVSGLLQQGYALGYLLAAVCYLVVFPRWGWRPLFFLGGLPALLALFVRARVRESEVWRETRHDNWSGLGRAIAANWKLFVYLTILMATMKNSGRHPQRGN